MLSIPVGDMTPELISAAFSTAPGTYTAASIGSLPLNLTSLSPGAVGAAVQVTDGTTQLSMTTYFPLTMPQALFTFPVFPATRTINVWAYRAGKRSHNFLTFTWTLT